MTAANYSLQTPTGPVTARDIIALLDPADPLHAAHIGGTLLGDAGVKVRISTPLVAQGSKLRLGLTIEEAPKGAAQLNGVPPPGIEPEPLGLQPSAQTNYARVGYERCTRWLGMRAPQIIIVKLFDCQRDHRRRPQGAPPALMHWQSLRVHLSRFEICNQIAIRKFSCLVDVGRERPETSKGHSGCIPGWPFS